MLIKFDNLSFLKPLPFVNKDNAWHNFDVLDDKEIRKTVCITKRIKVKEQPPQWVLDKIAATTGVIK